MNEMLGKIDTTSCCF